MAAQVGSVNVRPHFIRRGDHSAAILMVVGARRRAVELQDLALRGLCGGAGVGIFRVPAHHLAMRGIAEIVTVFFVRAAESFGIRAHGDGHGFQRFILPRIAGLGRNHFRDIFFLGHSDRKTQMILARVNAQRKMQTDGRKIAGFDAVIAGEVQFANVTGSGNCESIAVGADGNACTGLFFARRAGAPV